MKHVAMFVCVLRLLYHEVHLVGKYIDFRNMYDVSNIKYEPMFPTEYRPKL